MSREGVHFEVLADRGSNWKLEAVCHDQAVAVGQANEQMATGRCRAVKVVKSRWDPYKEGFVESEVFFAGQRVAQKVSKGEGESASAIFCWKAEDIYSYPGRVTIRRLLPQELDRWRITPLELIHSLEYIERLEDSGTALQRAVQRLAITQVQESGQNVQERIRELYDMVSMATARVRKDHAAGVMPKLDPDTLADLVERLAKGGSGEYLLNCALTAHLQGAKTWREKVNRLIDLVPRCKHPLFLKSLDGFLAEILTGAAAIHEIFGAQNDLASTLTLLADLHRGQMAVEPGSDAALFLAINDLVQTGGMPTLRIALGKRVLREMEGFRRLTAGGLLEEASAQRALFDRLKGEDGRLIGGDESLAIFAKRSDRLIQADAVTAYLDGADGAHGRVERLLDLESKIIGAKSKRQLAEFLVPLVTSAQNEPAFVGGAGTPIDRIARLARLQERIRTSELGEGQRGKLSQQLDAYAVKIMREAKLFERLEAGDSTFADKAMTVLRLCAGKTFPEGNALSFARERARLYMRRPKFLDHYLGNAKDQREVAVRLFELQKLLDGAGISA